MCSVIRPTFKWPKLLSGTNSSLCMLNVLLKKIKIENVYVVYVNRYSSRSSRYTQRNIDLAGIYRTIAIRIEENIRFDI